MQRQLSIEEKIIPSFHSNIKLEHIKPNGKLIEDKEITSIKKKMKDEALISYPYENGQVIQINGKYYATYVINPLGKGAYGEVIIAQDLDNKDQLFAIKTLTFDSIKRKKEIAKEEQKFLEKAQMTSATLETLNSIQFVMQLAPGITLASLEKTRRIMPTIRLLQIAYNCLDAITQLHNKNLLHCDIKSENLMIDEITGNVTPIDLGFAKEAKPSIGINATPACGTLGYMSPEVWFNGFYSEKSDVYALGQTLGELFGLTQDYYINALNQYSFMIVNKDNPKYTNNPYIADSNVRELIYELIVKMTNKDKDKRPTLEQAKGILKKIIEEHLLLPAKINNIGLLDINEYSKNPNHKDAFIAALKNCDEVWFVDNGKPQTSIRNLIQLRRELEDKGVSVGNRMFNGDDDIQNIILQIPKKIIQSNPDSINNYFLATQDNYLMKKIAQSNINVSPLAITPQKTVLHYRQQIKDYFQNTKIDPKHLKVAIHLLKDEILRLKIKYKNSNKLVIKRIDLIENFIDHISAKKVRFTYADLSNGLETLQQRMTATGKISNFFNIRSTGAEKIASIKAEIQKDVKSEAETRFKLKK